MKRHYEEDDLFNAEAYRVEGWKGIAWRVLGWATEPDEDTEWTGIEQRTGQLVARMVGDDRDFLFEPDEVEAIREDEFCHECGQIGCKADGRER